MNRELIIFGTGPQARLARRFFDADSSFDVVAFTADEEFLEADSFDNLPCVPFEKATSIFPPESFDLFVAIGYTDMNRLRQEKYEQALARGYSLPS